MIDGFNLNLYVLFDYNKILIKYQNGNTVEFFRKSVRSIFENFPKSDNFHYDYENNGISCSLHSSFK